MGTDIFDKFKYSKSDHTQRIGCDMGYADLGSSSGKKIMEGTGVEVEGQITSDEGSFIEGNLEGMILAINHEMLIGKSGHLKANIIAGVVRIEGTVKGDISGMKQVVISTTENGLGNIQSPRVTLEDGEKFKASIEMDPGNQVVLPFTLLFNVKLH